MCGYLVNYLFLKSPYLFSCRAAKITCLIFSASFRIRCKIESMPMTPRQRFLATYLFGSPDKVPLDPGYPRESTLLAWHQQGLPEGVFWRDHLWELLRLEPQPKSPVEDLGVNLKLLPEFDEVLLEHKNGHLILQDFSGAVVEISDQYDFSYLRSAKDFVTRHWHSFPVKSRQDWEEKMTWRYDARDPRRYPPDFAARCARLKERETPFSLTIPGPFWQLRDWIGLEPLCLMMVEQPEFIDELVAFWTQFMLDVLRPVLAQVEVDFIQVNEDMAYKLHSMISPRMIRRFLMPCWARWGQAFKASRAGGLLRRFRRLHRRADPPVDRGRLPEYLAGGSGGGQRYHRVQPEIRKIVRLRRRRG